MKSGFQELFENRHLLYMLTWKDIKIRYKQTVMGFLWAIFMPILIVCSGVIVKKALSIASGQPLNVNDIVSVSVKALPWSFFISSIRFATVSLIGNRELVTKIYFPREILPISAVLANLFDFAIASLGLLVILILLGVGLSIYLLWVPVLMIFLILLTIALGILLSCANLFFRDVKYIVDVLLTFGIFFTPVFFDVHMFGNWATLILLNPVAPILESLNTVIVYQHAPDLIWLFYSACWSIIGLFASWKILDKAEYMFAENI